MKRLVTYIFTHWPLMFFAALVFLAGSLHAAKNPFVVVIDAGHGGHDPGALGRRGKEKNINLNVALRVGQLIESNCPDTKVVYTRTKDVFVALHQRAEIANKAKADLFISIHTNSLASRNAQVSGTETYTLGLHKTQENLEVAQKENSVILIEEDYQEQYSGFNPNSAESYIIFEFLQDKNLSQSVHLARLIQQQFKQTARRTDKGVHQAGFLVLRETSMPSVLVELGYITNPNEEAYLMSEQGVNALAKSIYQAFIGYKDGAGTLTPAPPRNDRQVADQTTSSLTDSPEPAAPAVPADSQPSADDRPVFKIQILTADRPLPKGSKQLKGLSPVSYYKEKGIYKYTFASDTDYNKVLRIKREKVDGKFKDAFIIAFKNGEKMNINKAIQEFKNNRKNRK